MEHERTKGITMLRVEGYKSISQKRRIEIRPLTILAGANSSGKSSIMQPLLLLKQTLEATFDPGALLLNGPIVKFTSVEQVLSRASSKRRPQAFHIGIDLDDQELTICYRKQKGKGFDIKDTTYYSHRQKVVKFREGMSHDDIEKILPSAWKTLYNFLIEQGKDLQAEWVITRNRCFLWLSLQFATENKIPSGLFAPRLYEPFEEAIRQIIHLPGLRGNPERTYPVTAVGSTFPGTFGAYFASVIAQWQLEQAQQLHTLGQDLETLGLTCKVVANPINDTQVELQVGRLLYTGKNGTDDMVSIADVGFGVSQTLPVVVALLAAEPGQLVYIEQPEIHLHPRAQVAMAELLANAAKRGVRVVAETHSDLLLTGVQSLVAEGRLPPELVKLHWFTRESGVTNIVSTDLDEAGSFAEDWPEDFGRVALETQSRYLDAAESRRMQA